MMLLWSPGIAGRNAGSALPGRNKTNALHFAKNH
jgi:hypothetical protein